MEPVHIAIIGGGPGGLLTAYLLQTRSRVPLAITIYEASSRLGGKIVTSRFNAAPIDYESGAAELYDYSEAGPDPLRELVNAFNLSTRPMEGHTVVLDGQFLRDQADIQKHCGNETADALREFTRRAGSLI